MEIIKQNLRGFILSIIAVFIWAISILLTTVVLNQVPKYTVLATRFIPAAVLAVIFYLYEKKKIPKITRADWIKITMAGFFGVFLAQYFMVARRYTDAPTGSDVIFILSLAPIFIFILAGLFYFEELNFPKAIGLTVSILGMVVILANWELPSSFSPFIRYFREELNLVYAGICWAVFSVLIKDLTRRIDSLFLVASVLVTGSVPILFITMFTDGLAGLPSVTGVSFNIIGTLALVGSLIGYLVWIDALKETTLTKAGTTLTAAPLLLTLLIYVERRVSPMGISPLQVFPISFGFLLTLIGLATVWKEEEKSEAKFE